MPFYEVTGEHTIDDRTRELADGSGRVNRHTVESVEWVIPADSPRAAAERFRTAWGFPPDSVAEHDAPGAPLILVSACEGCGNLVLDTEEYDVDEDGNRFCVACRAEEIAG